MTEQQQDSTNQLRPYKVFCSARCLHSPWKGSITLQVWKARTNKVYDYAALKPHPGISAHRAAGPVTQAQAQSCCLCCLLAKNFLCFLHAFSVIWPCFWDVDGLVLEESLTGWDQDHRTNTVQLPYLVVGLKISSYHPAQENSSQTPSSPSSWWVFETGRMLILPHWALLLYQ